jgi:hypothetical protein
VLALNGAVNRTLALRTLLEAHISRLFPTIISTQSTSERGLGKKSRPTDFSDYGGYKSPLASMQAVKEATKECCHSIHHKFQLKSTTPPALVYGRLLVLFGMAWFGVLGYVVPEMLIPVWFDELVHSTTVWNAEVNRTVAFLVGLTDDFLFSVLHALRLHIATLFTRSAIQIPGNGFLGQRMRWTGAFQTANHRYT